MFTLVMNERTCLSNGQPITNCECSGHRQGTPDPLPNPEDMWQATFNQRADELRHAAEAPVRNSIPSGPGMHSVEDMWALAYAQ